MAEQAHIPGGSFYCSPVLDSGKFPQQSCYLEQYETWANIDPQLTHETLGYQSELTEHNFDLNTKIRNLDHTFNAAEYSRTAPLAPRNGVYEQTSSHEWPIPVELYSRVRYMSPNGPIGGSLSEVSSPSAYTSASISTSHLIQPSVSPSMLPSSLPQSHPGHVFENHQYQPWQADSAAPYITYQSPHHFQAAVSSQDYSMYPSEDIDFNADEANAFEDVVQGEDNLQATDPVLEVERHSSFRAPEEVQSMSEDTATPSTTTHFGTGRNTDCTSAMTSNDGYDDALGETSLDEGDDRASDADWTGKPARSTRQHRNSTTSTASKRRLTNNQQGRSPPKSAPQGNSATRHNRANSQGKQQPNPRKIPHFAAQHNKLKTTPQERSFPCVFRLFGCDAVFANKNEWKRHVASQHVQLGYYRCDLGNCCPYNGTQASTGAVRSGQRGRRPSDRRDEGEVLIFNDFNRKDLFTQHCRRMHGPQRTATQGSSPNKKDSRFGGHVTKEQEDAFEAKLDGIRRRCWRVRRKAPGRSYCGFCRTLFDCSYEQYQNSTEEGKSGSFAGPEERAWEDRMEHVGKHYEKGDVIANNEDVDDDLKEWGLAVGVLEDIGGGRAWLANATNAAEEVTTSSTRNHRKKRSRSTDDNEEETPETKRTRQQPSRRTRHARTKQETDDDEDDEEEAAQTTSAVKNEIKVENEYSDSDAEAEDE